MGEGAGGWRFCELRRFGLDLSLARLHFSEFGLL